MNNGVVINRQYYKLLSFMLAKGLDSTSVIASQI